MARINTLPTNLALIGALSSVFLSSCALPPQETWQRIQEEGLIPYLAHKEDKPTSAPANHQVTQPKPQAPALVSGPPGPASLPVVPPAPTQGPAIKNNPSSNEVNNALVAQAVPSLPGFVRSPYTNPPRLVDVKGTTPGATMICPYTQRPFVIPQDYANPGGAILADKPTPELNLVSKNKPKQTPAAPVVASNNVAPKQTPVKPQPAPVVVASNNPKPQLPPAPVLAPEPVKPAAPEIPYGQAIVGRPGFVNSPYAAKHQLVDVTGLPPGMEVKCPYTGKLFRVPQQEAAATASGIKKDPEPSANPAPVEKK